MDDFESFTREKITRLRAEADALESILKDFQAGRALHDGPADVEIEPDMADRLNGQAKRTRALLGLDADAIDDEIEVEEDEEVPL